MKKTNDVLGKRLSSYKQKPFISHGCIGNLATGKISIAGKQFTIYVTLQTGEVIEAINTRVPNFYQQPVIVGMDPDNFSDVTQVLSAWNVYSGEIPAMGIGPHREQHEWPNYDAPYVKSEVIYLSLYHPVAGQPKVVIYPGNYLTSIGWKIVTAKTIVDLTSSVPTTAGKARYAIIAVDLSGAFVVRNGTEITGWSNLVPSHIPTPVKGDNCICAVKIFAGQKEFRKNKDNNDFTDLRFTGANNGSTTVLEHHGNEHISTGGDPIPDVIPDGASGLMPGSAATKLAGIEPGAQANVNADWNATSGDAEILNKPTIPPTGITIKTVDGTVDVNNVLTMVVSNDTLIDEGDGQVTLDTGGGGTLGAELIDLTSQVTGMETHFTFSPAALAIIVFIDGAADSISNITMDMDGLGFTLASAPLVTSTLQILRMTSVSGGSGHTIQDNGSAITPRPNLNIIGAVIEDDVSNSATKITLPSIPVIPAWVLSSPDMPPTSPDVMDDEFDGSSLDSKWTAIISSGASSTITFTGSKVILGHANAANEYYRHCDIFQTLPTGPCKFRAKVNLESMRNNFVGIGLTIRVSSSGRALFAGLLTHTSYGGFPVFILDSTGETENYERISGYLAAMTAYFEIEFTATDVIWRYSTSGDAYSIIYSIGLSDIGAIDQIGIGCHPQTVESKPALVSCDWFRRIS